MYDIVAIGSATQDVFMTSSGIRVLESDDFTVGKGLCIPFGSKLEVDRLVFASGGGGTNAAVTFARQGLRTACVGVVGQDANARTILDELRREGIDAKYFQVHDDDITAYSVILVAEGGERTILSYKGEGQHFIADRVPWDRLKTKWLYLDSLGGSWDMLERAVQWAAKEGIKLASNPGGKELAHGVEKLQPLLKHFTVVAMNQEEASKLTGIPFERERDIFRAMDDLIGGVFVMTKGSGGSVVSDGERLYEAGVPTPGAVERTGAGDAFNSGFVAEYSRTADVTRAIQVGTANASSVVQHFGAKEGILHRGSLGPWPPVSVRVSDLT